MATASSATPLLALDALAIDTETTGLDARKARIVEIALVPIAGGRLGAADAWRRLVRPDVTIPAGSIRIHGIDAAAVQGAPTFAELWSELAARLGDTVLIGHSVGFDLAVLQRECARAGVAWTRPRALDTRLLAQVAAPDLASYALESLAAWLDVEAAGRHSALGDAAIAGRIFLALLPRLREGGIRTLAEAERACSALTEAVDKQHRAGWVEPAGAGGALDDGSAAMRVDSYPYRHRVRDVMSAPAKFAAREDSLAVALQRMAEERISSLLVRFEGGERPPLPAETGIVTERDAMRALARGGADALGAPVGGIATRPLATVPAEAFAFLAMARMNRLHIRHLGVTDELGRVIGALSARDLLRLRAEASVELGDEIEQAADVHGLARAWARLPHVASGLMAEKLSGLEIAALISHQVQALTQRAVVLAEQRMREGGQGEPPCAYAFAVLGSAGRGESLLAMDQDNALIFADGIEGGNAEASADRWFAALAGHAADILHQVGVPYCKGGVMAKNPQWRGSVSGWRRRIGQWIDRSKPADLLSVDIFFDMRGVHGDVSLADQVWREAFEAAKGQIAFAKLLLESAGAAETGLTFLGGFRTEKGRIDLKKAGLFGLVTAARALAICHHVRERSTPSRLRGVQALGVGASRDLDALVEAQGVFLDLLLSQQVADIGQGIPPTNAVEVKRLSGHDRDRLRSTLKALRHLDEIARELLFQAPPRTDGQNL
jgi:DNA polymerase-3 subunit epsilon/CBS domain-containing protein